MLAKHGTYALVMACSSDPKVAVGKLGSLRLQSGFYVYVGSAFGPGGLKARIARHRQISSRFHWHIDYLLNNKKVELTSIYTIESGEQLECRIAKRVARHGTPVPRFGCSDCKCTSHLYKVEDLDFITEIGLKKWA